ncbi:MAG: two-component system, cell cycle sensor histidine kinase and response regulator CckA [Gaiellaceae bacterium]|nr:two-component system, cell cycle sensor histidine kinase and response regulator CckA [Gaiellaceae bacterium]
MTSRYTRVYRSAWLRLLGQIGAVVIVLTLATAGILVLRGQQEAAQSRRFETQRLHSLLHAHSALEWHGIADGRLSAELRGEVTGLDETIRQSVALLLDSLPRNPVGLARGVDAYLAATQREFGLVEQGKVEAARELDETVVDPTYESVEKLVEENDQAFASDAEASSRNADLGSIGIAAASLVALLLLGGRILRAERAVAREAALAAVRLEREEELRQTQKIEAVALLASGVAHDFNNLLTIVTGYSELVVQELGPEHACRDAMANVLGAADRASKLTHQLLAFGGKQSMQPAELELGAVCEGLLPLLNGAVGRNIDLSLHVFDRVRVFADSSQLEQVLLNFVVNARDAMPNGGQIDVAVGTRNLETELKLRGERLAPGHYAELVVKDTGSGIDEQTLTQIFDPYFTTRGSKGHGLGLSSVRGIVSQSGGLIGVESTPGLGSEFHVYLPALRPEPESLPVTDTVHPAAA